LHRLPPQAQGLLWFYFKMTLPRSSS